MNILQVSIFVRKTKGYAVKKTYFGKLQFKDIYIA